jgi:hypothetical protein
VPPYGAGLFAPGAVLLVGEQSNVARLGQLKFRLPFVTFAGSGIGPWLANQLERAGIAEDALYWINAYDASGAPNDPRLIAELQPARIVALGRLAERWCLDAGVEYVALLSPSAFRTSKAKGLYISRELLQ